MALMMCSRRKTNGFKRKELEIGDPRCVEEEDEDPKGADSRKGKDDVLPTHAA